MIFSGTTYKRTQLLVVNGIQKLLKKIIYFHLNDLTRHYLVQRLPDVGRATFSDELSIPLRPLRLIPIHPPILNKTMCAAFQLHQ